jgi:hypothetical protein
MRILVCGKHLKKKKEKDNIYIKNILSCDSFQMVNISVLFCLITLSEDGMSFEGEVEEVTTSPTPTSNPTDELELGLSITMSSCGNLEKLTLLEDLAL